MYSLKPWSLFTNFIEKPEPESTHIVVLEEISLELGFSIDSTSLNQLNLEKFVPSSKSFKVFS